MVSVVDLQGNNNCKNQYDFWKNYRKELTSAINNNEEKLEKNSQNIVLMAKKIGIKPTARYFNISPTTVRNYMKKNL